MVPMSSKPRVALVLAAALTLAGCSAISPSGPNAAGPVKGPLTVVASFYPLEYITQRIGGDRVRLTSLTKPGAEPHDLELSPQDVASVSGADLVVYLRGFQPSVDAAVSAEASGKAFDASTKANLDLTYTPIEAGKQVAEAAGSTDPHFWLDPTRLRAVAAALATRMEQVDPAARATFAANEASLSKDLTALDAQYRAGLAHCANKDLITSHNAFGYLAQRYHLRQVGITGLTPDAEPNARELADVTNFVRTHHVTTIYYETLVSPAIADTVARETGARTEVLDPIEGLNKLSQGRDYLAIMRANLANLRSGQGCS